MPDPITTGIAVVADLLRVVEMDAKRLRKGAVPLMMEFAVNPETAPFLVSSTRAVMWITPRKPAVRAAVRPMQDVGAFFREVVDAVAEVGAEAEWGNVQPFTAEGVVQALGHVRSYDLPDLEILAHPDVDWQGIPSPQKDEAGHLTLLGFPLVHATWLDLKTLIVVPQDRDYLGFVMLVGGRGLSVVHNASRGMAIIRGTKV